MKTPDCVIWALTKRNNAYITKFNGNEWTHNPLSLTGLHNASSTASTINVVAARKKTDKKKFKRTFNLLLKHKLTHGAKKARSAKSQSKVAHSEIVLSGDVHHAAKVIQGLTYQNQKEKNLALRRLARGSAATRSNI
jgi:hypothetical protein